ncbi:MAG: sulfurtransferase-like selenium metabolism protein YedF [Rikenellaceae bacterium]
MITVDARGMACPQPLIETKKAIDSLTEVTEIEVLLDNETSQNNVVDFLSQLGISAQSEVGIVRFTTGKINGDSGVISCPTGVSGVADYTVVVNRLTMGSGSDELGVMLMKAYFSTIAQSDSLPSTIIFYNEGVRYAAKDSAIISTLKEIENKGVMLIICGTCVDYFGIKESIEIGVISNMYKISQTLQNTAKIVYP